jgi:hypothetical protein
MVQRHSTLPVEFDVTTEVFRARRKAARQQMHELMTTVCLESVVELALFSEG